VIEREERLREEIEKESERRETWEIKIGEISAIN
jgi:hypothetical protein